MDMGMINITSSSTSCDDTSSISVDLDHQEREKTLKMKAGSCYLPRPKKGRENGDDAHFVCKRMKVAGVADGVGGCSKRGIDPGDYARELMARSKDYAVTTMSGGATATLRKLDPVDVLWEAYFGTDSSGSSTACIVALDHQKLKAVNVGDSGFIVVRDGYTIYKSKVQLHSFNTPYQLNRKRKLYPDDFTKFERIEVDVKEGDIVVLGTDGLFDKVFEEEIESVIRETKELIDKPEELAKCIAEMAQSCSKSQWKITPYSVARTEFSLKPCKGGKPDDITVVVLHIVN